LGGVPAGGACGGPPCPAFNAVSENTNEASAMLPAERVNLVERCMMKTPEWRAGHLFRESPTTVTL
jgi:hypothetical protein